MSNTSDVKVTVLKEVRKRDGSLVNFDTEKIVKAALAAMTEVGEGNATSAQHVADKVGTELEMLTRADPSYVATVEEIQDIVEKYLILGKYVKTAKAYILYRHERNVQRIQFQQLSENVQKKVEESKQYFSNPLSEFVYYTSYSKWIDDEGRRESWVETVERFISFMRENLGNKYSEKDYKDVEQGILTQQVIPSMRLLWASGPAVRASQVAAYNCSFIAPTKFQDYAEIMYISMCGCGVGFSVEKSTVEKFPVIQPQNGKKPKKFVVEDCKEGWADSISFAMEQWYAGFEVVFDYSKIRPKGARLKTMGGRASGPQPLIELHKFARGVVLSKQGRKLDPIDVHDIICMIGQIVVAGGVRRSAMISLSDLDDTDMRDAKAGQFWNNHPQRSMSNNSAIYTEKPTTFDFMDEWIALAKSGSGERGIFNRGGLKSQLPARRWSKFKDFVEGSGTNPCGEIILRSKQFCNLTSIVARADDTEETLMEKIRLASILGTYQASLTNFSYLSEEWKANCDDEALLGVSFTGYWDCDEIRKPEVLQNLRDYSVKVNSQYAKKLKINPSTCITCVKPSGNSSQLLDTSSGMHPRHAKYYIRRVRVSANDPIFNLLKDQGVPYNPEVGQSEGTAYTYVLEFPVKAPDNAVTKNDLTALDLLEHWKNIKLNFTEHNPSCTVSVSNSEWIDVAQWVYTNWEDIGGLSFLPRNDHVYQLAPYEECDEAKYLELIEKTKNIDFSKLVRYENNDQTKGSKELACVSGACEL